MLLYKQNHLVRLVVLMYTYYVVNAIQNVDLFNEFRILISGGIPAGPGARPAHFQH